MENEKQLSIRYLNIQNYQNIENCELSFYNDDTVLSSPVIIESYDTDIVKLLNTLLTAMHYNTDELEGMRDDTEINLSLYVNYYKDGIDVDYPDNTISMIKGKFSEPDMLVMGRVKFKGRDLGIKSHMYIDASVGLDEVIRYMGNMDSHSVMLINNFDVNNMMKTKDYLVLINRIKSVAKVRSIQVIVGTRDAIATASMFGSIVNATILYG